MRVRGVWRDLQVLKMSSPFAEIRRSQNNPDSPGGQHTNGPPPFWIRFGDGPWRRIRWRRSGAALRAALEALLELDDE